MGRPHAPYVCSIIQSRPTFVDPMDYSSPGSSVHGVSQQEYWSGLPFPPLGDLPGTGIKLTSASPALAADSLPLSHLGNPVTYK